MLTVSLFDEGAPPPCPRPFNMAAMVLACATTTPKKTALEMVSPEDTQSWSFARLEAAVLGTAAGLRAMGLAPGERVLMRLANSIDFPIIFLGAIAADLVPVPTSAQLTEPEVARLLPTLKPSLIVADEGVAVPAPAPCPVLPVAALTAMRDLPGAGYAMGEPDRPGYIICTSGTSGAPRPVVHAHRAIWARRMMWQGWYGLGASDRLLHAGAFNWTYTLGTGLMDPWAAGATALIPAGGADRHTLPVLARRHGATLIAAAPGVFRQILATDADLTLPHLRHGLSAGEKLPDATRAAWRARTGTEIFEALGLSECSTFISASPARHAGAGSSGRPQPGRRVAVLGAVGDSPVAVGQPGLLAVSARDAGLMLGYREAGGGCELPLSGEWFVTGDIVSMAPDASITYLGRDDDMMNAGGYRVSPLEVEAVLTAHPAIAEAAAVSVAVRDGVEIIAAFYTGDHDLDGAALKDWCAARLARYKCPRVVKRVEALPRGANGKLRRARLRETWKGTR